MLFIIHLSVVFATAMLLCMSVLIARRGLAEQQQTRDIRRANEVTRAYLRRLAGAEDVVPPKAEPIALDAVLHLSQLLRGAERDRMLEFADGDGLFDLALTEMKRSRPPARVKAIRMLGQFGSERCVESLRSAMAEDPRPELRLEAAGALAQLGRLPSPADTIAMLRLDHGPPTRLHLALLRSLAPTYLKELGALLDGNIPLTLRCAIVDAIGWSGDYSAADLIEQAARHEEPEMRCAALRAARQLGRPDASRWILPLLADSSPDVRVNAIRACETLRIRVAVDALELLLQDRSWWVRSRAEEALATLRPNRPASIAA